MRIRRKFIFIMILFLLLYIFSYIYTTSYNSVSVSNLSEKEVYPVGRLVGLKLYTNGVLVVGMSEIEDENGLMCKPYENSKIMEGDLIKSVNGVKLKNVEQLIDFLNENKDNEISIKYQRDKDDIYTTITPVKTNKGDYMLGLWVRDAAAGIGTLTYYDEKNMYFAALGHGIDDIDTGKLLNISNGELVTAKLISIVKGESKIPGEIRGTIDEGLIIGNIEKNTNLGVYGMVNNLDYINKVKTNKVPVANRNHIKPGQAFMICQLSSEDIGQYEIEVKKIFKNNFNNNKSMLIKVKDRDLIDKTGGIIPGMSGAPIIQNGKLIGAITNVLLNDPTQGYAVFADMMF